MHDSPERIAGTLRADGGPLYYEVAGRGHPLVLIHAGVADHRMWDGQFELYAQHYRVVRYDTRGFGRSTVAEGHTFSNRRDLLELMNHLGIESAYVTGVSRGGQIAVDFTLEHPDKVDALIAVSSGLSGDDYQPTPEEAAVFARMDELWNKKEYAALADLEVRQWVDGPGQPADRVDPRIREKVRRMIVDNYTANQTEGTPVPLDPPAAGRLAEIKVPTLVIAGALDGPDVLQAADKLARGVRGARKVVIPGTAHLPSMERPQEFNRIVLEFLGKLPGSLPG